VSLTAPEKTGNIEALQSEILADATSGPVLVELTPEVSVRVLPARMWRLSGYSAIKEGDFLTWAAKCLASMEDYEAFIDADPTFEQINRFFERFGSATGEVTGQVGAEGNSNSSSSSPTRSRRSRKS
jgi:hypothetical protein